MDSSKTDQETRQTSDPSDDSTEDGLRLNRETIRHLTLKTGLRAGEPPDTSGGGSGH